jgi:crotonobetainyl-CoA:carnitine CoA-transferase CaiB-like acyl-CoA transferase
LQAEQDPQVKHLNAITSYDHPVAGTAKVVAPAVKLSKTPPQIERPAPLVGQHYHEILHEYGFSDAEIAAWSAHGTVEQSR